MPLARCAARGASAYRRAEPVSRRAARRGREGRGDLDVVRDLERQLGRLEVRLKLMEWAESTAREERDRLLRDLEEERAERRRLQERLEEREHRRNWWQRMFGG